MVHFEYQLTSLLHPQALGQYQIVPVEVKSCVSPLSTESAEKRLEKFLGVERYDPQETYFLRFDADNPKLFELIGDDKNLKRATGEFYQVLHHTYTYGVEKCLLIIGSNKRFLYAIEITFSRELLRSYNNVMNLLYERYYEFLYCETLDEDFPVSKIEQALELKNLKKKKGDTMSLHLFMTNYRLWRSINVEIDSDAIKFPLPPMDRFLPNLNAGWNLSKHPSDTLTKLFDECEESIGVRSPQTIAVSRFLAVLLTAFHRLNQITNANNDLDRYKILNNFCNAANNRAFFKTSLSQIADFLWGSWSICSSNLQSKKQQQRHSQGCRHYPPQEQQETTTSFPRNSGMQNGGKCAHHRKSLADQENKREEVRKSICKGGKSAWELFCV